MLEKRDKAIAAISNAIAVYSIHNEQSKISQNQSMIDFILKSVPEDLKSTISIQLIDEVFEYISSVHLQPS
ncbi:MAG: hypothetical protein FJ359_03265 [Thaumarchaeota archaeon]|nr:hypothetical protein [Nitrososphaerota archaeon]